MQYLKIFGIIILLTLSAWTNVLISKSLSNRGALYLLKNEINGGSSASAEIITSDQSLKLALAFSARNSSAARMAGFLSWFEELDPRKLIALHENGKLDPIVAIKAGFTLLSQGQDAEAVKLWNAAGLRNYLGIIQSQVSIPYDNHDISLTCTLPHPDFDGAGDIWYYLGLMYEKRGLYEKAIYAYKQAFVSEGISLVGRSSPYYRIGIIYQWYFNPPNLDEAKASYETALVENDFASCAEAADAFYKHGEVEWWLQNDPATYIVDFQRAVELNPEHASAHMQLGIAYFSLYKNLKLAETELQKSIDLSPDNPWGYFWLADIYQKAGYTKEAIELYQQAVNIAPTFEDAKARLKSLKQ